MLESHLPILKRLSPFAALNEADLEPIVAQGSFKTLDRGSMLFKRSSSDTHSHWLLSGRLNLINDAFENRVFTESDSQSYGAVDEFDPHRVSAVCEQTCVIFSLPKTVQEKITTLLESAAEAADQDTANSQWMERLLRTPLFEFIPAANIQQLFKIFESVSAIKGEVILKQGDPGDYFYVIKSGALTVSIESQQGVQQVAELTAGQTFGQDALVSDLPRNATVTATTACKLARISEPDFEQLLMTPVIGMVKKEELDALAAAEGAPITIIDIRVNEESKPLNDVASISIPFIELRDHLNELPKDVIYVVQGPSSPKIGMVGAYLLNENGFIAYVLEQHS